MKTKKIDKFTIIAACVAFIIGSFVFTNLSTLPVANLHLHIEGIDTDLGVTTRSMSSGLAESDWSPNPSYVRVDPDLEGTTVFTETDTSGLLPTLFWGHDFTEDYEENNDYTGQPDIIVTTTNPRGPNIGIVGDPTDFTAPNGEKFKLYKTIFYVTLKTDADAESMDSVYAEVAFQGSEYIGGLLGSWFDPPVGSVWEGNVYIEYSVTDVKGAFIYEARLNQDPKVGIITEGRIDTSLSLTAPSIQAQAHAHYEKAGAIAFYDSIDGNQVTDFVVKRTPRGILPIGGKLGVGADPKTENYLQFFDKFTGWNLFNVAIKYQIAVVVAVPYEQTVDSDGKPIDPTKVLPGSTEAGPMGDPRYYDLVVEDEKSLLDLFKDLDLEGLAGALDKAFIIIIGVISIILIALTYKFFNWIRR